MLAVTLSLVAAAAAFAASALFSDSGTGRVGPLQLSRWQMGLAFLMTTALSLVLGGWRTIDLEMALIVLGIVLAVLGPKGDEAPTALRPLWLGVTLGFSPRSDRRRAAFLPVRRCWQGPIRLRQSRSARDWARGDIGTVTTLSSTTPILILPMVWAVSGRLPGPMAWVGAALAVVGTALISLAT